MCMSIKILFNDLQRVFTPRLAVGLGCLQLPPGLLPLQAIPAGALDGIVGAGEMNQQQIHIVRLQTLPVLVAARPVFLKQLLLCLNGWETI